MAQVPIGLPADEVLKRVGRPERTKSLGVDPDGFFAGVKGYAVEWEYPWEYLVLKRREVDGVTCYRVMEKRPKGR